MSDTHQQWQRLADNITLLGAIDDVPSRPLVNDVDDVPAQDGGLSLRREAQLADDFAFIAASTDASSKIAAVCIEQRPAEAAMTICIAFNTRSPANTFDDFNALGKTLENCNRHESRQTQVDLILDQIIRMDFLRIQSRLRSRHARKSSKVRGHPPMPSLLAETVYQAQQFLKSDTPDRQKLANVQKRSQTLLSYFQTLENTVHLQSRFKVLKNIVEEAAHLGAAYTEAKQLIVYPKMEATLQAYLPEALRKLGRYFVVAQDLVAAARNHDILLFSHVSIRVLEPPQIPQPTCRPGSKNLEEALSRFCAGHRGPQAKTMILAELRARKRLDMAQSRYLEASRLRKVLGYGRVHAEIQLLCFYQSHPELNQPRVLCASKSACYLCHVFIKCHGIYSVPRTHGRIHDAWLLPPWRDACDSEPGLRYQTALTRLNLQLEQDILALPSRKLNQQPNESVTAIRLFISPTSTIVDLEPTVVEAKQQDIAIAEPPPQTLLNAEGADEMLGLPNAEYYALDHHSPILRTVTHQDEPDNSDSEDSTKTVKAQDEVQLEHSYLERGQVIRRTLSAEQHEIQVVMPKLKLLILSPSDTTSGATDGAICSSHVEVTYLKARPDPAALADAFELLDTDKLSDAEFVTGAGAACSSKTLLVKRKDQYVSIKFS